MSGIAPTLEALKRLIAFDTTSRNSNLQLIDWVEDYLRARGVASVRVADEAGGKANLMALVGPQVEGGVVLSGHTDVVPVDGQAWASDPWTVEERDGKLYGRGVADMKSFIAIALAHVDEMLAAKLKRPIILAFSYDEEIGCLGAPGMIRELMKTLPAPSAAIIGEPTDMKVVSAHKGITSFTATVEGREAHSSQINQGVSAIGEALKLMNFVTELSAEAQARAKAQDDGLFSPPGATMTIGLVEGGTALNILAKRCSFGFDLRSPDPEETEAMAKRVFEAAAALDKEIKARAPEGGVTLVRRPIPPPPLKATPNSAAEVLARALTGDNGVTGAAYAAEAGLFQRAGVPAVLCGPGSILQAHQPDEWITLAQIEAGALFMRRLIAHLAA
ncbi:MAG: acetylornithine deacetylase [Hyphomonadaceae bacterium]|nr:acetylornithine deacetylase [Hyphomonadaceae bacterium]